MRSLAVTSDAASLARINSKMRTRPQPRQRWRVRLTLLAASCVLCWLRLVRRSLAPVVGLVVPTRWPACAPDGGTPTHAAPLQRRSFDGTRLAIVSTWLPTRCGIATYSAGLRSGLLATGASVDVVAVHLRSTEQHAYGPEARFRDRRVKLEAALRDTAQVVFTIRQDEPSDYVLAAHYLVEQACACFRSACHGAHLTPRTRAAL